MKKTLKRMLIGFIILASAGIAAVFAAYNRTSETTESPSFQKAADISAAGVQQTATRGGMKEWTLDAVSAQLMEAEKQAVFKMPSVTFFPEDGKTLHLTAKEGIVRTDSDDIEARGQVVLKRENYKVETEHIRYENGQHKFSSDTRVSIVGKEVELAADAMSFDINTNRLFFRGNVKGVFSENFSL